MIIKDKGQRAAFIQVWYNNLYLKDILFSLFIYNQLLLCNTLLYR